ncbi:MAG: hypothetical protein HN368_13335 [Spirochaetales bacterium]|jgi:hypothetical protein|nr:hypothetical protein [Spirochaetales bacterium]
MKKFLIIGVALLFVFGAIAPIFAEGKNCGCSFVVENPNHTQTLGGKSGHSSHKGLHIAAKKSGVVTHVHK